MASTLAALNDAPTPDFVAALGAVFAQAPWVAEAAAAQRPFPTVTALFGALRAAVEGASDARRLALLAGSPGLAGPVAGPIDPGVPDSLADQEAAGLERLSEAESARFAALNAAYREAFGHPFILCAARHGRASLLANVERRLASSPDAERRTAEAEVMRIAAIRLNAAVTGAGPLATTGRISTHVLDTVQGRPAAGVAVELVEFVSATETAIVARAVTNADGRTDVPLIHGRPVPMATYELRFGLGDHFRRVGPGHGPALPEPPFLDIVPLRFGVGDPEGHYHVPLVATPWSYQTYRGS